MVVVAIVGVLLVMVRLRLPDRVADSLAHESRRIVAVLNDCRDSAVLSGSPAGIRVSSASYEIARYRRGWHAVTRDGAPELTRLPLGLALQLPRQGVPDADAPPDVVCLPTGETVLPALRLTHAQAAGFYEFRDGEDGRFIAAWVEPRT